jgi:hypothetical protein
MMPLIPWLVVMNLLAIQQVTKALFWRHVGGTDNLAKGCHFRRNLSDFGFLGYAWHIVRQISRDYGSLPQCHKLLLKTQF